MMTLICSWSSNLYKVQSVSEILFNVGSSLLRAEIYHFNVYTVVVYR